MKLITAESRKTINTKNLAKIMSKPVNHQTRNIKLVKYQDL